MKKKICYIVLAVAMAASLILSGCGKSSKKASKENSETESSTQSTETATKVIKTEEQATIEEGEDGNITIKTDSGEEVVIDTNSTEVVEEADGSKTYKKSDGTTVNIKTDESGKATVTTEKVVANSGTSGGNTGSSAAGNTSSTTGGGTTGGGSSSSSSTHTHNFNSTVVQPTCTEQGYTLHECSCGKDSYKDNYTAALGHDGGGNWVVVTEATTSSAGRQVKYCTRCGAEVASEAIPQKANTGSETDWSYNGNTRTKTLYDGTTLTEQQYSANGQTFWGYYDRAAATTIVEQINLYRTNHQGLTYLNEGSADGLALSLASNGPKPAIYKWIGGMPIPTSDYSDIIMAPEIQNCNIVLSVFVKDVNTGDTYGKFYTQWFMSYYAGEQI